VLLAAPPDSLGTIDEAQRFLMRERVDLAAMRAQLDTLVEVFREEGVTATVAAMPKDAPPNVIFMRDLFLATPDGALVGRTASGQRAGEERHATVALAGVGVPILATVAGKGTLECADVLWLDEETVVVGVGFRTNAAGADEVARVLAEQGASVVRVQLGAGVQHLLGSLMLLDHRLAAVHATAAGPELRAVLRERDYRLIELPPDEELTRARGMNMVTLRPGQVLMPTGAPSMRRTLESAGVEVRTVEVGEYVKADGALGCLTGIVSRD
jgi:N-dimethylarginine dimethylaminohydrolase